MSYKKSLVLSVSVVASNFMMLPQTAFAQDEASFKIDEIVVTARKREESLQDVPLAVTALDKAALDNLHTSTITGIDRLVPNIDLGDNPFTGLGLAAVIRGIGSSDPEKTFEPTVGLSIDGVFLASNTGAAIDAFDLEYAEVLRGPQGTLFGRNTVGGVINVRRSRPTGEAGLKLGTRITNHNGREYYAVANLPQFEDAVSTKLYAFSKEHDTFATNTLTGEKDPQKDLNQFGGAILVEPNDQFEALISFDYFDDDSFGPPAYNLNQFSLPGQGGDLFCFLANGGIQVAGQTTITPTGAGCASTSIDVAEASNFEDFTRATPFVTNIDGWSLTSNIEYDLNDNLTLTSVTGYRETNDTQSNSTSEGALAIPSPVIVGPPAFVPPLFIFGDQPFDVGLNFRNFESSQFSQELRLSGDIGDKFNFVAGLYYLNSKYNLVGGEFEPGVFGTARPFNANPANNEIVAQQANAYAAFIDVTYPLTDRLSLSGGLRYSYEEKDFQYDFLFRGPDALGNPSPVTGTSADASDDWQAPTWRATLQYDVSNDINVYGGYTRGFRSGGFNGRAGSAIEASTSFDEETVDSFEIGARTEFFDNRLRINPTAFLAIYDDKQEDTLTTTGTGASIVNAAVVDNVSQVDIKGVELEVLARITESLTFQGTFGHVDAEFDEFLAPEVIGVNPMTGAPILGDGFVDVSDERNLRSGPDTTFTVGATYDTTILDGKLGLTLDGSYNFQSEIVTSALQDPLGLDRDRVDGNKGFDFSASVTTLGAGPKVTLTGFINDAFDSDAGRLGTSIVIPGIFTFGVGVPTTVYGLDATVEF